MADPPRADAKPESAVNCNLYWCKISDQPEADTCKMLDLRTNRKWTSGWGYLTYSTPRNSKGYDRLAQRVGSPMNPRNIILYIILIGKEARGEILFRLKQIGNRTWELGFFSTWRRPFPQTGVQSVRFTGEPDESPKCYPVRYFIGKEAWGEILPRLRRVWIVRSW